LAARLPNFTCLVSASALTALQLVTAARRHFFFDRTRTGAVRLNVLTRPRGVDSLNDNLASVEQTAIVPGFRLSRPSPQRERKRKAISSEKSQNGHPARDRAIYSS